jgi:hypothetical protein
MASPKKAKAATACGERPSDIVGSGGRNEQTDTKSIVEVQALRLMRRFALSLPVAIVVASLHYGEAAR